MVEARIHIIVEGKGYWHDVGFPPGAARVGRGGHGAGGIVGEHHEKDAPCAHPVQWPWPHEDAEEHQKTTKGSSADCFKNFSSFLLPPERGKSSVT